MLQQDSAALNAALVGSLVESCPAGDPVPAGGVGLARHQEDLGSLGPVGVHGHVEGGVAAQVGRVGAGVVLDQELQDLEVTVVDSQVDSCLTVTVLGRKVLVARLEELVHNLQRQPMDCKFLLHSH